MKTQRARLIILSALAMLMLLIGTTAIYADGDDDDDDDNGSSAIRTYEVTITNLTAGQPFTPRVLATHKGKLGVFKVGEPASVGVHRIAENGQNAWLMAALSNDDKVFDVVEGAGISPAGASAPILITGDKKAKRFTFVNMLICTNDGFTGINSLKLPKKIGDVVTASSIGYDAGTESNTEAFANLVPPCSGFVEGTGSSEASLAEGGVVEIHPGIMGGVDLDSDVAGHGWIDPVANISIERIS